MNFQNDLEFLDMITIISFAIQMQMMEQMSREATNNDILCNLHHDLEVVDAKLSAIIQYLNIDLETS